MKTKAILITRIGMVAITGLVLVNRNDSTQKPLPENMVAGNAADVNPAQSNEKPEAPIMQRVGQLQSSRKQPVADPDMLAQFEKLLLSDQEVPRGTQDPAWTFLEGIPVADRKPATRRHGGYGFKEHSAL